MKEVEIISKLSESDGLSIAQLSSLTHTSVPTVTKYLNELLQKGWIVNTGKASGEHGRKASIYRLCEDTAYFLGVDPKHSTLSLALMDMCGKIVAEFDESLLFQNTPEMIETICGKCEDFISSSGIARDKIRCAAFNISGRVNPANGQSYSIFNFENNEDALSDTLSNRLGIRSLIDNDTRLMAYGEMKTAIKGKYSDFLFINVGWGIGLSIIIDGKLYCGTNGFSGEFGHTSVYDNEIMCHCGKKGCLETEVGGRAICNHLQKRINEGETSSLKAKIAQGATLDENDIINAALNDDMLSIEVIEKAGYELGRQIANLINLFNPQAVIIGGSMQKAGDIFIEPVKLAVRRYSLRLICQNVAIFPSTLADRAGSIGACLIAREAMFSDEQITKIPSAL